MQVLSIVKLGWSVNIRSMHVGSKFSCCKPKVVVRESICEPSFDLMSSFHHDLDLALK